jgi:hypothetical protein
MVGNNEGGGVAGVVASWGGMSSPVDGDGSSEFPEHGEREEGVTS